MTHPDPIAFTLFGVQVRWYGILIAAAILLAVWLICRRAPQRGISPDDMLTVLLVGVPCGILGARLYSVAFHWDYYGAELSRVLDIRSGGLAIHGGLIAGVAGAYLCWTILRRRRRQPGRAPSFADGLDIAVGPIALAQAIGRWGNFFNGEAHGGPTDLPWAILVDGEYVHPTFLYESIWCLFLFFLLSRVAKKHRFTGQALCLYGILYSAERFFVEVLRTDSLMLGPLKQAQVLSLTVIILALIGYAVFRKRRRN